MKMKFLLPVSFIVMYLIGITTENPIVAIDIDCFDIQKLMWEKRRKLLLFLFRIFYLKLS